MVDRFTVPARKVMQLAKADADRRGHRYIQTEHILIGLAFLPSGFAFKVLKNLGIDPSAIWHEVEKSLGLGKTAKSPHVNHMMEKAIDEAQNLDHRYVGTEHFLIALMREEEECQITPVLTNLGVSLEAVRNQILENLGRLEEH